MLHARFADKVSEVIDVQLPPATYDRLKTLFDAIVDPNQLVADWIIRLYDVQEGLTAAYYHYRNIEHLEHDVTAICLSALQDHQSDLPPTTMNFGARRMTYEYQAFLFALSRSFDYLGKALTVALECRPAKFRQVPKQLKAATATNRAAAAAITSAIAPTMKAFPEVFSERGQSFSQRDRTAHDRSVPAGTFTIVMHPGMSAHIELVGGGEELPFSPDIASPSGRLPALLHERLVRFEETIFELVGHLPAVASAQG